MIGKVMIVHQLNWQRLYYLLLLLVYGSMLPNFSQYHPSNFQDVSYFCYKFEMLSNSSSTFASTGSWFLVSHNILPPIYKDHPQRNICLKKGNDVAKQL